MAREISFNSQHGGEPQEFTFKAAGEDEWIVKNEWISLFKEIDEGDWISSFRGSAYQTQSITLSSESVYCYTATVKCYEKSSLKNSITKSQNLEKSCNIKISRDEYNKFAESNNVNMLEIKCVITLVQSIPKKPPTFLISSKQFRLERLSSDMEAILKTGAMSDVLLISGSTEIKAHKLILATRSTVFQKMFENPMKENLENRVIITDVETDVLREFLHFVYTGVLILKEFSFSRDLYTTADKYGVEDLKDICRSHLKCMALDTVIETLVLADAHDDNDLKTGAMQFIADYYKQMKIHQSWQTFLREYPLLAIEVMAFKIDTYK